MAEGGGEQKRLDMRRLSWVRMYNAYFQAMVVEELVEQATKALGTDAAFRAVAEITRKGAMRGFKVLHEEARKAGVDLSGLSLREVLEYEVRCHSFAIEGMGVPFQLWERLEELEPGRRYALHAGRCNYAERVKRLPATCAVCLGFFSGILTRFGHDTRWVRSRERARQLCHLPPEQRPRYVVYRDPGTPLPQCRIVVERLECPDQQREGEG
ncbi:MAG: hypothetical protein GXO15_01555 [Crenarchaeota archaeon]|nr:hypothetical protein [Thermoproteota archaeon]